MVAVTTRERTRVASVTPTGLRAPTRKPRLRGQLELVDNRATKRRERHRQLLLALFALSILGFFLVAVAQAKLVAGQQKLDQVQAEIEKQDARKAQLERQVNEASSPKRITERADNLGMVPAAEPVFVDAWQES